MPADQSALQPPHPQAIHPELCPNLSVQGKFTLPNTTAHATYTGTVGASVQYFGNPLGENNIFGASGEICASATCK